MATETVCQEPTTIDINNPPDQHQLHGIDYHTTRMSYSSQMSKIGVYDDIRFRAYIT